MAENPLLALPHADADRERVEDELRQAVAAPTAAMTEMAGHLLGAGGKRVRPLFAIAAGGIAAGHDGPADLDVVRGGVSVELVHLGSLLHDDVIDEAVTRRGIDSVNARWGNLRAILAGDFLLAKASEIAAGIRHASLEEGETIEGAAAVGIAALLSGKIRPAGPTVLIVSGGNIDPELHRTIVDNRRAG